MDEQDHDAEMKDILGIAARVVDAFSLKHPSVVATSRQWNDRQIMILRAIRFGAERK